MTARPKNNLWMADFMVGGIRFREFGFASKALAEAWELEARAALKRGLPPPPASPTKEPAKAFSVDDLVRYCTKHRWSDKKAGVALARNAELFSVFVSPDTAVSQALSQRSVDDYVAYLRDERECSGGTINRRLSAVSVLCDYAVRLEKLDKSPIISWQKEGEHRFRWFTEAEAEAIFKTLRHWGLVREAAFFEFLCDTGCRVGEALKLERRDVSAGERAKVTFWDTKNGKARTVPLTARAKAAVFQEASPRPGQRPFSDINRYVIRSTWDRLRLHLPWLEDAVVHTFRHTCASWLVQRGVDLMRVKEWMGHSAIQTTLRYAKLAPKHLEDLVNILEKRENV